MAAAEQSGLEPASIDLVTVAQALHWFDIDAFFGEVGRVLRQGGVLAVWSYARCTVDPACDDTIEAVFAEVDDFWPPERDIVESRYAGIEMPFPEIPAVDFAMTADWTADQMLDYMRTWSAARRYLEARGTEPVSLYEDALRDRWGTQSRRVSWPLVTRVCRKP